MALSHVFNHKSDYILPMQMCLVCVMRGNVEKFDYASSKKVISRDENLATLCSSDVGHTDESRRRQKEKVEGA